METENLLYWSLFCVLVLSIALVLLMWVLSRCQSEVERLRAELEYIKQKDEWNEIMNNCKRRALEKLGVHNPSILNTKTDFFAKSK